MRKECDRLANRHISNHFNGNLQIMSGGTLVMEKRCRVRDIIIVHSLQEGVTETDFAKNIAAGAEENAEIGIPGTA